MPAARSSARQRVCTLSERQVVLPFSPQRSGVFFLNADSFIVVDRTGAATNKHNCNRPARLGPHHIMHILRSSSGRMYGFPQSRCNSRERCKG